MISYIIIIICKVMNLNYLIFTDLILFYTFVKFYFTDNIFDTVLSYVKTNIYINNIILIIIL